MFTEIKMKRQNTLISILAGKYILLQRDIKGTPVQIWKSDNIFVFRRKQYVEDFTLKHLLLFEYAQSLFSNIEKQ